MYESRPTARALTPCCASSRAAGAGQVFRETASGAETDRAQLRRVLGELAAGDVLMVARLDRVALSTRDPLNTLAAIADREAGFRSLGDTWGRRHDRAWPADADRARGAGRVRARADPRPDGRGSAAGRGARGEDGAEAEAHPAADEGGDQASGSGRGDLAGDRAQLQCQP